MDEAKGYDLRGALGALKCCEELNGRQREKILCGVETYYCRENERDCAEKHIYLDSEGKEIACIKLQLDENEELEFALSSYSEKCKYGNADSKVKEWLKVMEELEISEEIRVYPF